MATLSTASGPVFRALSIDGGGMRGIYSAAYLAELEDAYAKRRNLKGLDIGKAFQLIVGTSTGAIIGCGLALGKTPASLMRLYRDHGAEIFPKKMPSRLGLDLFFQLFNRPQSLASGEKALQRQLEQLFSTTTLSELWTERQIALAVPAVNMSTCRSWVFKTPHNPDTDHRDDAQTLVDVCLASSAAPLFRSLAAIEHQKGDSFNVFADGGLWANNPVLVTLVEALRIVENTDQTIEIFCLGTCGKPEGEIISRADRHRGLSEWKFGGRVAAVSISAQEFAFDAVVRFLARHMRRSVRIIRFPTDKLPAALLQYLEIDETRPEGLDALIRQARQDAHMTNSILIEGDGRVAIDTLFTGMPGRTE